METIKKKLSFKKQKHRTPKPKSEDRNEDDPSEDKENEDPTGTHFIIWGEAETARRVVLSRPGP